MFTTYILYNEDREYNDFKIYEEGCDEEVALDIIPFKFKLFNLDTFITSPGIKIINSMIRHMTTIPGVLILSAKKTYGVYKDKLLYQCIPDDNRLPTFLVPYKLKSDFKKQYVNKYVTFRYETWCNKHPSGRLTNVLGDVSKLETFYEYQLYCKSLNYSIQNFTRVTANKLKEKTEQEFISLILERNPKIRDYRENTNIFCIDPIGSADFDDALSITKTDETGI